MRRAGAVVGASEGGGLAADVRAELHGMLGDDVRFDVPLAGYSTYRIGGPAAALVRPRDPETVSRVLQLAAASGMPTLALGLGSNVLIDDAGFQGIVLRVAQTMAEIERIGPEGTVWRVGAGLPTPRLARRAAAAGLAGVQRLVGVPGAVGGGVFMNAGAHGQEFADVVRSVEVIDEDGTPRTIPGDRVPWAYRDAGLTGVVVAAELELTPDDPAELKRDVRVHLRRRREGTPFDQPCCGSVFRNPSPDEVAALERPGLRTAGRLIDAAGLKGYRVGGAEVSPMHANYIVNVGNGTAADVRAVIRDVRERVEERFGMRLQVEVKIIRPAGNP